jgi:ATP-dependent DNA helicase RecG
MLEPSTPVQYVKGIGPRLAEVLAAKGIATVDDLLHYLPFRYEDRLNPRSVAELRAGEMAAIQDCFAPVACRFSNSPSARDAPN